jgi:hypothetical protein
VNNDNNNDSSSIIDINNSNKKTITSSRPPPHQSKKKISVIDTPRRKITVYSFALYYFVMSSLVGAPLPFPSLVDVSSEHVAFINFLSLLVTLVGSIIGIGFYIERRNNLKFDQQNAKMDRIDQKIDQKVDGLSQQLRDTENRICKTFDEKLTQLERNTEYKVQRAKDIEDERFKRIDELHREHERRLDTLDRDSYDYTTERRKRSLGAQPGGA